MQIKTPKAFDIFFKPTYLRHFFWDVPLGDQNRPKPNERCNEIEKNINLSQFGSHWFHLCSLPCPQR